MQKLGKLILIACGILVLGVVAVALSANLYIESKDSQARIERKISRVLRVPVKITATSFSLWSGLQVKGISIPQSPTESEGNFFEAGSFTASFELWALTKRKLVIRRIGISQPQLFWYQTAKGKWRAPSLPSERPSTVEKAEEKKPAAEQSTKTPPPTPPFEVSVDQLAVNDGAFQFFDHDKKSIFAFAGVNGQGRLVSATEAHGKIESTSASLRNSLNFQNLHTDFAYANKKLSLQSLVAKIAGGDFRGGFNMDTEDPANPFSFKGEFDHVDVNRLVADAGGADGQVTGQLAGSLEMSSNSHKTKDLKGTGRLALTHGKIQQYDLFQMLGQALQIEELSQLNLQQALLEFHFDDGKAYIDQLLLQSPNLQVTATGIIRLDGKMNLSARLSINRTISRRLPGFVADNFHPLEGGDLQFIDFEVTGTVGKPRTNLLEIALGKKIEKEMGGILESLFGGKKRKEPKKASQETQGPETLPPLPSSTPLPTQTSPTEPQS